MDEKSYDCIIIGGGPAGLVASIYLQRFQRRILLVDRGDSRLAWAPKIQNLVGYSKGITGVRLLKKLRSQALQYKTGVFMKGEARVRRRRKGFEVRVGNHVATAPFVILATGFKDKQLPQLNCADLCRKKVVAYCAVCDGFEQTGKRVGVFVDSSAGLSKLNFLNHYTPHLHLFLIKDLKLAATHLKLIKDLGVKVYRGVVEKLTQHPTRKTLIVKQRGARQVEVDLAYVALGMKVNTEAIENLRGLKCTKPGLLLVNRYQETSIRHLYAIGDCVNDLAQVSVAVGEAAIAATHIHHELSKIS